jgi:hypothetical protein
MMVPVNPELTGGSVDSGFSAVVCVLQLSKRVAIPTSKVFPKKVRSIGFIGVVVSQQESLLQV